MEQRPLVPAIRSERRVGATVTPSTPYTRFQPQMPPRSRRGARACPREEREEDTRQRQLSSPREDKTPQSSLLIVNAARWPRNVAASTCRGAGSTSAVVDHGKKGADTWARQLNVKKREGFPPRSTLDRSRRL